LHRFESILRDAIAAGASDVHLEPRDKTLEVRLRIDGRLFSRGIIEERQRESVIQAAKILGRMDIAERRLPQDGRGLLPGPLPYALRFSCIPAVNGESLVVRLLPERGRVRPWRELELSAPNRRHLDQLLTLPHGLIYVTGPTGSGKTTLLHSLLADLGRGESETQKIITLEEPVEIRNPRCFLQLEVDERIGRGFPELLRHVLRHDPDILLVGETRDRGTADITLRAALAGRLCLSTLHTNSAVGAVPRLTEMGLDPLLVSTALRGVIAQRLVRRPCPSCQRPHPQAERWRDRLGERGQEHLAATAQFVAASTGSDCPDCAGRGFRGRVAMIEVVPLAGLERLVAAGAGAERLDQAAREAGCPSLFDDGLRLAAQSATTIEEVCAAAEAPLLLSEAMNPSYSPASRRSSVAAFTLIEILAVLAVIAAIIAIGVPAVSKVLQSARVRNAEGTASVVRSALVQFQAKPGASGTLPLTEGSAATLASEYTGTGTVTAAAVAAAATLDNILLSEGFLERPLALRLGTQGGVASGAANGFSWIPASQSFTGTAAPTLSYANVSRAECSLCDGVSNPGLTGQAAGSAACAFTLSSSGSAIAAGAHVAYLIIKSVPDGDAYQLALDVDGPSLVSNTSATPASLDQTLGTVVYAKDSASTGFVDVYYYLTAL
jgi:type II secretory ATPase GspE/PulE/Tfp pilus assembly ATPase PilB-like protein/type II secretory pathway pseudopilin PulG